MIVKDVYMYEEYIEEIKRYDVFDIIARLAGTTIESRNQNKTLFIDTLIDEITSLARSDFQNSFKMSAGKFRRLINQVVSNEQIRLTIDPNENIYKQRVIYRGNHWVFNGIDQDPAYYLQLLVNVLQEHNEYDTEYLQKVDQLISTVLEISDFIENGLKCDDIINDESKEYYVPDASKIERNSKLVTFDADYIRQRVGYEDVFNEMCVRFQHKRTLETPDMLMFNPQDLSLFCHPFIYNDSRNQIIVSNVALLPSFLIYQIFTLARGYNLQNQIFDDFNEAVFRDCITSISRLGYSSIDFIEGEPLINSRAYKEAIFSVSETKRLLLIFGCDEGGNYSEETVHGIASNEYHNNVEERYPKLLDIMSDHRITDDNIIVVVCISSIGRSMFLGLPHTKHKVQTISFSPFDLWCISMNEMGCEQFLARYVRARNLMREHVPSLFSELNAVEIYKSNHNSFVMTDDAKMEEIFTYVAPGDSVEYIQRAIDRFDKKQVDSWRPGEKIVVIRNDENQNIYVTTTNDPKVYIEISDSFGIWVISEPIKKLDRMDIIRSVVDLVTYWIDECKILLKEISLPYPNILLLLSIDSETVAYSQFDTRKKKDVAEVFNMEFDGTNCFILHWSSELALSLVSNSNDKEKRFIQLLLAGIGNAYSQQLDFGLLDVIFENPFKRKIYAAEYGNHPSYRPTLNFYPRNVHDEDLTYLNDTIIPQYTNACHWNTGEIKYGERSKFMVDVVGFLYKLLQKEVASMSPQHLVERIYSDIESNTFKLLQLSSIYKYEVACYPQKQTKFLDQYNELNRSLISQKFLIEYVASCPPNGKKVFDTLDYEWILSICSAIIEYAYYGDLFKYDIFHTPVEILQSGRIGMNHVEFNYMNDMGTRYRDEELDFNSDYRNPTIPPMDIPDIASRLDSAFNAEFGYSNTQLADCVNSMCRIGMSKGSQSEVFISSYNFLINAILQESESGLLTEEIVGKILSDISICNRENFLVPPEGYQSYEVWPWRFNRRYSFMRRPLIFREIDGGQIEVIWGIRSVDRMLHYIYHCIKIGSFPAQSEELKELMGYISNARGKVFNDYVYDIFLKMEQFVVDRNVNKINGVNIQKNKQALGDIDVLVIDHQKHVILAVEVKSFRYARNPYEMAMEHKAMFEGEKSFQNKHQRRVDWLREHINDVKKHYRLADADWRIKGVFIVNEPQVSKDIYKHEIDIISKSELSLARVKQVIDSTN